MTPEAKALIRGMITRDPAERLSIEEAEGSPWLHAGSSGHLFKASASLQKWNSGRKLRASITGVMALNRIKSLGALRNSSPAVASGQSDHQQQKLGGGMSSAQRAKNKFSGEDIFK